MSEFLDLDPTVSISEDGMTRWDLYNVVNAMDGTDAYDVGQAVGYATERAIYEMSGMLPLVGPAANKLVDGIFDATHYISHESAEAFSGSSLDDWVTMYLSGR